jgi:hypothetical protein
VVNPTAGATGNRASGATRSAVQSRPFAFSVGSSRGSVAVGERLSADDFNRLVRHFEHTAFRLETLASYDVAEERESFADFLSNRARPTEPPEFYRPWLAQIRRAVQEGRRIERVRVLSVPPTEYQQWEIWIGRFAEAAGERIRYISQFRAIKFGLPVDEGDWWLLDSCRLARMEFDEIGTPRGGEIVMNANLVVQHCAWRDIALHYSEPYQNDPPIRAR